MIIDFLFLLCRRANRYEELILNGKILAVLAALVGAFTVILVTAAGIVGPTIAGGAGFAVLLWILALNNVAHMMRHNKNSQ